MRQAIETTYFGPTNFKGARVKASCEAKTIIVNWDHALNPSQNHVAAARALAAKLDWTGVWFGGGVKRGYVFVSGADSDDFVV